MNSNDAYKEISKFKNFTSNFLDENNSVSSLGSLEDFNEYLNSKTIYFKNITTEEFLHIFQKLFKHNKYKQCLDFIK